MNHDDPSEGAARFPQREAEGDEAEGDAGAPFSGEERPIVQRVLRKLSDLSDTLEEIEGWIDARAETTSHVLLPNRASRSRILLTPQNLHLFVEAERQSIVESRDALALKVTWRV